MASSAVMPTDSFQSTPPCGGDRYRRNRGHPFRISIHAPLRGRLVVVLPGAGVLEISIHAPLRGRPCGTSAQSWTAQFQSTPPCGGDVISRRKLVKATDFNPRPLAGATIYNGTYSGKLVISIHAPLRGRQRVCFNPQGANPYFNPRPLAGATPKTKPLILATVISIHAPLRGRPPVNKMPSYQAIFQSTPPCGGDIQESRCRGKRGISIHAPLRGRQLRGEEHSRSWEFQSTPPCGGDQDYEKLVKEVGKFQSTPPCGGDLMMEES